MGILFFLIALIGLVVWGVQYYQSKRDGKSLDKIFKNIGWGSVVLMSFVAIISLISLATNSGADTSSSSTDYESSSSVDEMTDSEKASSESASASYDASYSSSSEAAASSKAASESERKDPTTYQTGITYDQLARTPDDYFGKKVSFTGKVLQVMEDDDETQLRLAVDGDYDNVILVDIDEDKLSGTRILEDDLVTVSGFSMGTMSYKSAMAGKITIPSMSTEIINDQGKASDDYGY